MEELLCFYSQQVIKNQAAIVAEKFFDSVHNKQVRIHSTSVTEKNKLENYFVSVHNIQIKIQSTSVAEKLYCFCSQHGSQNSVHMCCREVRHIISFQNFVAAFASLFPWNYQILLSL